MNKLLLTLGTVLLISGCSKEPNIYLNCISDGGAGWDKNFRLTIDTSKKEFNWTYTLSQTYEKTVNQLPITYTEFDDKLITEKIILAWYVNPDVEGEDLLPEYSIFTFDKISGSFIEKNYKDNKFRFSRSPCTRIDRVME